MLATVSQFHSTAFHKFTKWLHTVLHSLPHLPLPALKHWQTRLQTCLPLIAIKPWLAFSRSLFEWQDFFGGDFAVWNTDLWVTQLPPKTNTSLCLSLHINSRPPVFTKCLFNENCIVSSLSDCLMAPVLLQVPGRGRDVWHKKAEPKTKTNNTCTPAHTYKHFTFQPHWVTSKSGSASN